MVFDDTHGSPRQSLHDNLHHNVLPCHQPHVHYKEEEILYRQETPVTLSRASSTSFSSSSSNSSSPSSFSSWYTDGAANNPYSLHHVVQPQHSLSCSNIADVRRGFTQDGSSEPVVFATIKQGKNVSIFSQPHCPPKRGKPFSSLDRGHSRSEEGLQQENECQRDGRQSREPHVTSGPLYKTTSLNRSLTFSTEDILLGVTGGPKRAVSSSQLPSKGILKNKEPHADIRKAKSMEVLSPRLSKGQEPSGQKGRGITQTQTEQARANFVQGKVQFSAFLDEITKQVMSPSDLSILGVNNNKAAAKTVALAQPSGPVKPQLPPKNYRRSSGEELEQNPKHHSRQEKPDLSCSRKHSTCSNPEKLMSYAAKAHQGSPPPHPYPHRARHSTHHSRKDRRASPSRSSLSGDRYGRSGPHVPDGTSTSPEPTQPKPHHPRKQPTASYTQQPQHFPLPQPQQAAAAGAGQGSESSSTKSDSSRTRDTSSTATSHSLELGCDHHSQFMGHCKHCRVSRENKIKRWCQVWYDLNALFLPPLRAKQTGAVSQQKQSSWVTGLHQKHHAESLLQHTQPSDANKNSLFVSLEGKAQSLTQYKHYKPKEQPDECRVKRKSRYCYVGFYINYNLLKKIQIKLYSNNNNFVSWIWCFWVKGTWVPTRMYSHTPKEEKGRYRSVLSVVGHGSIAHSICHVLSNWLMTRSESIVLLHNMCKTKALVNATHDQNVWNDQCHGIVPYFHTHLNRSCS